RPPRPPLFPYTTLFRSRPRPIDAVARISPRPLLLMHGRADSLLPYANSQQLYARAREPKELWLLDGADHCVMMQKAPDEYRSRRSEEHTSELQSPCNLV